MVDADVMPQTLETILTDYVNSPLAVVRQSSCVWLLSILRHAKRHPGLQVGADPTFITDYMMEIYPLVC